MDSILHLSRDQFSGALLLALVGIVCLLYLVLNAVNTFYRLRHFPGPPLAAWTELWLFKAAVGGNFHLTAAKLLQTYGQAQIPALCKRA